MRSLVDDGIVRRFLTVLNLSTQTWLLEFYINSCASCSFNNFPNIHAYANNLLASKYYKLLWDSLLLSFMLLREKKSQRNVHRTVSIVHFKIFVVDIHIFRCYKKKNFQMELKSIKMLATWHIPMAPIKNGSYRIMYATHF